MIKLFHEASFDTSRLITNKYSTSFSIAVGLLEPEIKRAIYAVYGFVRFADEIVDSFDGFDKQYLLEKFEKDYYEAYNQNISLNPILNSFQQVVKEFNIDDSDIQAFIRSMKADLQKTKYNNMQETADYIYGSADVVGLMCLKVFVKGDKAMFEKLKPQAMKLGSAFQKVNFLRDIKNDTEILNRFYFPQLLEKMITEESKLTIIEDIETDFKDAYNGLIQLPGKSKLAVLVAYDYYYSLLQNIKNTPASELMKRRMRVSDTKKLFLLTQAYLKFKFNLT